MNKTRRIVAWPFLLLGNTLFLAGIWTLALASRVSNVDYVKSLYLDIAEKVRS